MMKRTLHEKLGILLQLIGVVLVFATVYFDPVLTAIVAVCVLMLGGVIRMLGRIIRLEARIVEIEAWVQGQFDWTTEATESINMMNKDLGKLLLEIENEYLDLPEIDNNSNGNDGGGGILH